MESSSPTRELVVDIVRESLGERASRVERASDQGECNAVCFVSTENGERVLRLNSGIDSLDGYRKEQWCIEATAGLIPGPEVLAVGSVGAWSFMVETRIRGTLASTNAASARSVWTRLGEYAARLQDVPVQGYGFVLEQPGVFRDTRARLP